jgi:DNA replication protein DnaC
MKKMETAVLEKLKITLTAQLMLKQRFSIKKCVPEIPAMLKECYVFEVNKRRLTFVDDAKTLEHINKAAQWLVSEDLKPGLLLCGSVGNGKTTLARAVCDLIKILYDSGFSNEAKVVKCISALDITRLAKKTDLEEFEKCKKAELLFIDDIGTEPVSVKTYGNEITPVVEAIEYRYDMQLFTIATTNLDDDGIKNQYGLRTFDRMTEMFDKISFDHQPSYRK